MSSGTIPQEHARFTAIIQRLIFKKTNKQTINFYVAKQSIYAPTHS